MDLSNELLDLVGLIYDASYQQDLWCDVLRRITKITCSSSAALIYHDSAFQKASFMHSYGLPENVIKSYLGEYIQLDPFVDLIVKKLPRGKVSADDRVLKNREQLRQLAPVFHDDIMVRYDLYHIGGAGLLVDEDRMAAIAIQRREELGPWTDEELATLEKLTPHLQRAFRIHREFTRFGIQEYVMYSMLDQLVLGLMLLDRAGNVVYNNPAAEKILGIHPGIEKRQNKLEITDNISANKLHEAINLAAAFEAYPSKRSSVMALRQDGSCYPLLILITPVSDLHQHYRLMEETACVAVFLSDTGNPLPISIDALEEVYGLTRSEAEVALSLANGMNLEDISKAKQRSTETIRTQLKAVLRKTKTKNQADLVRLLLTGTFAVIN